MFPISVIIVHRENKKCGRFKTITTQKRFDPLQLLEESQENPPNYLGGNKTKLKHVCDPNPTGDIWHIRHH